MNYVFNLARLIDMPGQNTHGFQHITCCMPHRDLPGIKFCPLTAHGDNHRVLGVWFFSDTESALQWLESNRDREKYNGFFARISAQMPVRGPSGTADFDVTRRIYELLSVERQNQAIDTILEYLLHIPSLDADSWVDSLQNGEGRNIAIDHLTGMRIKLLADTDPLQALYQAGDFYGSNAGLIRRHAFHYALGSNPEQAMAWLDGAEISDDERAHLEAEATGRGIHTSVTD